MKQRPACLRVTISSAVSRLKGRAAWEESGARIVVGGVVTDVAAAGVVDDRGGGGRLYFGAVDLFASAITAKRRS